MAQEVVSSRISAPKIKGILRDVASGTGVEMACALANVTPADFDRFLTTPEAGSTRRALQIALARADKADLDAMTADSEAFGWQASVARFKMRQEAEAKRTVRQTNIVSLAALFG